MNSTTPVGAFLVREESIPRLERVLCAITEAAKRRGAPAQNVLAAVLIAGCRRCGARVSGAELVRFAGFPDPQESFRLRRLRIGRCVRPECSSNEYQLVFRNHPDIDWVELLSTTKEDTAMSPGDDGKKAAVEHRDHAESRSQWIRRALLAAAVVLLLIARQMYNGGRIPLLREPEKFRVAPALQGENTLH